MTETVVRGEESSEPYLVPCQHGTVCADGAATEFPIGHPAWSDSALRLLNLGRLRVAVFYNAPVRQDHHRRTLQMPTPEPRHMSVTWRDAAGAPSTGHQQAPDVVDLTLSTTVPSGQDEAAAGRHFAAVVKTLIPPALLPLPSDTTAPRLTVCLPVRRGIGAVLAEFLTRLITDTTPYSPPEAARLGTIVIDLTAAVLTHHQSTEPNGPTNSHRHYLISQVQAFIQRHLGDPTLTPELIAAAHHISVRSLHRLFKNEGTTVGAWIRRQRLNRCRRDLADPALSSQPIHAIAARWGFPRPGDFTRAFRSAYGMTPRDFRITIACPVIGDDCPQKMNNGGMDFPQVVRRRRMTRSFTDEPVDPEVVHRILDTARRGPSAGHSQGVEFVVVTDDGLRHAIAAPAGDILAKSGHPNFIAQAPVHVVLCVSPEIYRSRYREPDKMKAVNDDEELWEVPYWYTDAGAALMLMLLAAVDEGVAAAFVSYPQQRIRLLLGIPGDYIPVGIVLLGHEAPDARDYGDVSADPRPRRALADVVHYGRW